MRMRMRKFFHAACTNQKWLAKPALKQWLSLHLSAILFALCFKSIKKFNSESESETSPLPKIISNSFASCARLSTKDLALPFLQLCNTTTISTLRLYMPKNLTIVFSTAGFHPSCRRLSYQIRLYSFLRFINNIISSACNISVLQVCLLAGWRGNSFKLPAP